MRTLTALLTITIALVAAMPAAAQRDRSDDGSRYERDRRVSVEGRIRSFSRERDGVRIYLDRGNYSFFVPAPVLGRRSLRVGMDIRLSGVYRGGSVWVDDIGWPGDSNRDEVVVSGRVDRINPFERRLVLRDDRGRVIEVDARGIGDERRRRLDFGDIHRGDRVTLRGHWGRNTFYASRIENISTR